MSRTSISIEQFIESVKNNFPGKDEFTTSEIKKMPSEGISVSGKIWECEVPGSKPKRFSVTILETRLNNGEFNFIKSKNERNYLKKEDNLTSNNVITSENEKHVDNKSLINDTTLAMYIPGADPDFVPYGQNYDIIKKIIESNEFFPCYIYGVSGVGKTSSIEHVCSILKRPFFRVQITQETMDEDLIGSMKLLNGDTVWQDGPIIKAYRCGGVVVLDECDLNSNLMILQPILERKPFYIKQTGELVNPNHGFTVFATGNTKGDGNDPRYIGTTTLNEAFLERFAITLEQKFMPISTETKIAKQFCRNNNINVNPTLIKELMKMVDITRQTYMNNGGEGVYISTRRIQFILKAYKITSDINAALDMALARYTENEREALKMIWTSIHVEEPKNIVNEQSDHKSTETNKNNNDTNNMIVNNNNQNTNNETTNSILVNEITDILDNDNF